MFRKRYLINAFENECVTKIIKDKITLKLKK